MVLLLGNHSAGKSTFINTLMGESVQATGVAPTDDGFTLIKRGDVTTEEDGPTAVGTPSHGLQELSTFGNTFVNLLKMKVRKVDESSNCPKNLILVDSPGMIGSPGEGRDHTGSERGYDLLKVTRWFAERADCILIMFDPANPGTTGETLDVLTESLAGMHPLPAPLSFSRSTLPLSADLDHKFLIVMNKVDQFDNVADFARSYGALCWNLSKVVRRKDIPRIYTVFTEGPQDGHRVPRAIENGLPVEEFAKMRGEVVQEVLRAPGRQVDNLLTLLEQTSMKVFISAKVSETLRQRYASANFRALSALSLATSAGIAASVATQAVPVMALGSAASVALGVAGKVAVDKWLVWYQEQLIASIDSVILAEIPGADRQVCCDATLTPPPPPHPLSSRNFLPPSSLRCPPQDLLGKYASVRRSLTDHLSRSKLSSLPRVSKRSLAALENVCLVPQKKTKKRTCVFCVWSRKKIVPSSLLNSPFAQVMKGELPTLREKARGVRYSSSSA